MNIFKILSAIGLFTGTSQQPHTSEKLGMIKTLHVFELTLCFTESQWDVLYILYENASCRGLFNLCNIQANPNANDWGPEALSIIVKNSN